MINKRSHHILRASKLDFHVRLNNCAFLSAAITELFMKVLSYLDVKLEVSLRTRPFGKLLSAVVPNNGYMKSFWPEVSFSSYIFSKKLFLFLLLFLLLLLLSFMFELLSPLLLCVFSLLFISVAVFVNVAAVVAIVAVPFYSLAAVEALVLSAIICVVGL